MGGVPGVYAAKVVVIGAGVSGQNAAAIALGMQAEVLLLDRNVARLRQMDAIYQGHCQTVASNAYEVERAVLDADLVIGAVLVAGAKAPKLVSNELVSRMKPGSVLVDISIDQGGCFEDSRPTTHADPTYRVHDSVFYCVANMPGAVPHTSTYALTNVTLPYAVELANRGWRDALRADHALALGPEHPRGPRHQRPRSPRPTATSRSSLDERAALRSWTTAHLSLWYRDGSRLARASAGAGRADRRRTSPSSARASPGCGRRTTCSGSTRRCGWHSSRPRSPGSARPDATAAGARRLFPVRRSTLAASPVREAAIAQYARHAGLGGRGRPRGDGRGHRRRHRTRRDRRGSPASPAQLARAREEAETARRSGWTSSSSTASTPAGGSTPPARSARPTHRTAPRSTRRKLVRGLADVVDGPRRRGSSNGHRASCRRRRASSAPSAAGSAREFVVRATEGYTPQLPGQRRALVPVYSLIIATEPLPDSVWDEIGLAERETFADYRHLIIYGQRTADGRMVFGGRGAPYHFGSRIDASYDRAPAVFDALRRDAASSCSRCCVGDPHHAPRGAARSASRATGTRRSASTRHRRRLGRRVRRRRRLDDEPGRPHARRPDHRPTTDLTALPWVGHRSRNWEPEPLRWLGANAGLRAMTWADHAERRHGRPSRVADADGHAMMGRSSRADAPRSPGSREKASSDRADLDALLDTTHIGHFGLVVDGRTPVVIPTAVVRDGDRVLLHGRPGRRGCAGSAAGAPTSLAVTGVRRARGRPIGVRVVDPLPQRGAVRDVLARSTTPRRTACSTW